MGITNFFKMVQPSPIELNMLSGKKVAIDGYTEIYRAGCAASYAKLTDKDGNQTGYLKFLLSRLLLFKRNNIEMIFVFDGKPPIEKEAELMRRSAVRAQQDAAGKESFRIDKTVLNHVRQVVTLLGISIVDTPDGYDAEHVCADLNRSKLVDYVLTTDADAFAYGAISVIRPCTGGKYELYMRQQFIDYLQGDHIIEASVLMGTDFCGKEKGVGIKTVVKNVQRHLADPNYTDCQLVAIEVFKREIRYNVMENQFDKDTLQEFLTTLNFNVKKIKW